MERQALARSDSPRRAGACRLRWGIGPVFGSAAERALCGQVADFAASGVDAKSGRETSLREFIDLAAACRIFLTNDSGAMHVASALGVPTVAVFGATDDTTTGPTGPLARVVREHAECSPCLLRECPIDHRCMTRVTAAHVTGAAAILLGKGRSGVVQPLDTPMGFGGRLQRGGAESEISADSRGEDGDRVYGEGVDTRTKIVPGGRRSDAPWSPGRSMCWQRTHANWRASARATMNGPPGGGIAASGLAHAARARN